MVAIKFVIMALGAFAMTVSAGLVSPGTSLTNSLQKRGCDIDCNGALSDCSSRCANANINRDGQVEICHDGSCYCGFPAS